MYVHTLIQLMYSPILMHIYDSSFEAGFKTTLAQVSIYGFQF